MKLIAPKRRPLAGAATVVTFGLLCSWAGWRTAVAQERDAWANAYRGAIHNRVEAVKAQLLGEADWVAAIAQGARAGERTVVGWQADGGVRIVAPGRQSVEWLARLGANPAFLRCARRVLESGEPCLSDPLTEVNDEARVAIAAPMKDGVAAGITTTRQIIDRAVNRLQPSTLQMSLRGAKAASGSGNDWRQTADIDVLGQRWTLEFHPAPGSAPGNAIGTLISGTIMTLLAAALVWLKLSRRQRVEREVEARTQAFIEVIQRLRDEISQRQEAEVELARARDRALESSRLKTEFLTNISHELRTPLHGVLGLTQLTLDGSLAEDQRDYLETSLRSGQTLLGLLNELLDFNQIESNRLAVDRTRFSPRACVQDVMKMATWQARDKGLKLHTESTPEVPEWVHGDPMRLRQVLTNLVNNAIKFTDSGEVRVSMRVTANDTEGVQLEFCVTDTGIGVAPEQHEAIFEAFRQVDGSMTRSRGGTGIGLSICRRLVELMQGHIWISSQPGKGSRFYFSIRVQPDRGVAGTQSRGARDDGNHALRVLLVEDQPAHRVLVERMLQKLGHIVAMAENGQQGFERWLKDDFDVVLTDIQMPVLDGIALAERIRRTELTSGRQIPIVALTAHASEAEKRRCRESGLDAFLAKPFTEEQLQAILARIFSPEVISAG